MELSLNLKKLETLPGAFEIISYLYTLDEYVASTTAIMADLDMSERRFSKAIRRLVTTDYVVMGLAQEYRLTEQGVDAAKELEVFNAATGGKISRPSNKVQRRLLVALPRILGAGQPADLFIGFHPDPGSQLSSPANLVLRLSAMNANLNTRGDAMLSLDNNAAHQAMKITPGNQSQVRVKVQVFQLAPNGEDISNCGGMYIDVNVAPETQDPRMIAYGVDVHLDPL